MSDARDIPHDEAPRGGIFRRAGRAVASLFKMRIDKSGGRVLFVAFGFACVYGVIGARLVQLGLKPNEGQAVRAHTQESVAAVRPDIVDRNGVVLATDVRTAPHHRQG